MSAPTVSVVVPTFNQRDELRETFDALRAQRYPRDAFEVVVADDGSSDDTAEVVRSCADGLRVVYVFQEDQGFRLAAARNAGARAATGAVLVFLDNGTLPGPDFVRAHHELHAQPGRAVIGYAYGYQPWSDHVALTEALRELAPTPLVTRHGDEPWLRDWRHEQLAVSPVDVNDLAVPWILFQGMNLSLRAEDYWRLGGFDEEINHWGLEDLELGFRVWKAGLRFVVGREAWALELPGQTDMNAKIQEVKANAWYFLNKHHEPVAELLWRILLNEDLWEIEDEYRAVLEWTDEVRTLDVHDEIAAVLAKSWNGTDRIAILGCGARVPAHLPPSTLTDFDRTALAEATKASKGGGHTGHHAIGIRTALPDDSADLVIITSRLTGLWPHWGQDILDEAERIGHTVHALPKGHAGRIPATAARA